MNIGIGHVNRPNARRRRLDAHSAQPGRLQGLDEFNEPVVQTAHHIATEPILR